MRKLLFTAALATLVWAAFAVPLPVLVLEPHPAEQVESIIDLQETSDEISGQILFTAVELRPTTTADAAKAAVDPFRELTLPPMLFRGGGGGGGVDFLEAQLRLFRESVQISAAVGLRAAGHDVQVSGEGVRVVGVLQESSARDVLREGDVIVEANGRPMELATQLATMTSRLSPGAEIELTVQRGQQQREVVVTVRRLEATGSVGIGIGVTTVGLQIELPIDVAPADGAQIGGPSAGLMMALTVYDLVDPDDLTGGRIVAGTGTIDLDGNVGVVDGIAEKVRGAQLAGATVFLVPEMQADEAIDAAPEGIEVLPVSTFDDALAALQAPDTDS
ncbi:MAG: PDZ domain-containing protein [Nitriliruptorales bacterium]